MRGVHLQRALAFWSMICVRMEFLASSCWRARSCIAFCCSAFFPPYIFSNNWIKLTEIWWKSWVLATYVLRFHLSHSLLPQLIKFLVFHVLVYWCFVLKLIYLLKQLIYKIKVLNKMLHQQKSPENKINERNFVMNLKENVMYFGYDLLTHWPNMFADSTMTFVGLFLVTVCVVSH